MKINKILIIVILLFSITLILGGIRLYSVYQNQKEAGVVLERTWEGYKHFFVESNGRVKRPKNADTVSEGQAYAMLRAVFMNDQETFDRCYKWAEEHLSRKEQFKDNLLAWNWKDNEVVDWMPASDADIDYALSLLMAYQKWNKPKLKDLIPYDYKAKILLDDILDKLTVRTTKGSLYLVPWILNEQERSDIPQNPSYYSPAHFRAFYQFTDDKRWLELVDTTYSLIGSLSQSFDGEQGVGLIPDWCQIDLNDTVTRLKNKNSGFGWEAVRIPFRLGLDYLWFGSKEAKAYLEKFSYFLAQEWKNQGRIFCEYNYDGSPKENKYEDPLFYAVYYVTLFISDDSISAQILGKTRQALKNDDDLWIYRDKDEYFSNSLIWVSEVLSYKGKHAFKEIKK